MLAKILLRLQQEKMESKRRTKISDNKGGQTRDNNTKALTGLHLTLRSRHPNITSRGLRQLKKNNNSLLILKRTSKLTSNKFCLAMPEVETTVEEEAAAVAEENATTIKIRTTRNQVALKKAVRQGRRPLLLTVREVSNNTTKRRTATRLCTPRRSRKQLLTYLVDKGHKQLLYPKVG